MNTDHRATPKQWEQLEDRATDHEFFFISSCVAELRDRIEALEAAANSKPTPNPRQIRSSAEDAPAGGLVERVLTAIIEGGRHSLEDEAIGAVLAVADWLEGIGRLTAARCLREEVER